MIFQNFLLHGLMFIAATSFSIADDTKNDTVVKPKLQNNVMPLHYNVEVRYFPHENVLFGQCSITMKITYPSQFILLHSVPIIIHDAKLIDGINIITYKSIDTFVNEKNILTLYFDKAVLNATFPNTYTLNITYSRNIFEEKENDFGSAYLKGQKDQE